MKLTNKALAIFGIVSYILSVLSSAEDLEGNSTAPLALIIISGITTIVFFVLAVVRLWKLAKYLSIIFTSSTLLLFIFTVLQVFTFPLYGSPIIVLLSIAKVIRLVALVWVIVKLFKTK